MTYEDLKNCRWIKDADGSVFYVLWWEQDRALIWKIKAAGESWEQAVEAYDRCPPNNHVVFPDSEIVAGMELAEPPPNDIVAKLDVSNEKRRRESMNFCWGYHGPCFPIRDLLLRQFQMQAQVLVDFGCPVDDLRKAIDAVATAKDLVAGLGDVASKTEGLIEKLKQVQEAQAAREKGEGG